MADLVVALFAPGGLYQETRFRPPFVGDAGIRRYWDTDVVARRGEPAGLLCGVFDE